MSLEKYQKFLYEELPSQNLAFIEGGVLIYPSMIGLSLPMNMSDNDMFQYLNRFIQVMTYLEKAKDETDGKERVAKLAEALQVPLNKFMQENQYLYMTECVMNGAELPTNFDSIQKIYSEQARKARLVYMDVSEAVEPDFKKRIESSNNFLFDLQANPNKVKDVEVETVSTLSDTPPPFTPLETSSVLPQAEEVSLVLKEDAPQKEEPKTGIVDKTKSMLTKPPVLIGILAIAGLALSRTLISDETKDEEQPKRLPNRKKSSKRKKLKKQGYRR